MASRDLTHWSISTQAIGGGAASERGKLPGLPPYVLLDRPYRAVTWETERGGWHCRAPGVPH